MAAEITAETKLRVRSELNKPTLELQNSSLQPKIFLFNKSEKAVMRRTDEIKLVTIKTMEKLLTEPYKYE